MALFVYPKFTDVILRDPFNAHSVLHVLKRAGYIRFIDKYSWE